jgi:putative toxin-antitoxin system antitoxin component (TIGR02293 family)
LPEQSSLRTEVRDARERVVVAQGEPWSDEYIEVVRKAAELKIASRTVLSTAAVLFAASVALALSLILREHGGDLIVLISSIASAVFTLLGAVLGYKSARSAERVESSLDSEVSKRLRTREAESLILMRALEVFGDSERAIQWMRENNPALNNVPPVRVIQSEEGQHNVLNILGRIQHGVIS